MIECVVSRCCLANTRYAAALCDRMGSVESAKRHRQLSRATILKIADSLAPGEPLRNTFLSATAVAEIVGSFAGDKGYSKRSCSCEFQLLASWCRRPFNSAIDSSMKNSCRRESLCPLHEALQRELPLSQRSAFRARLVVSAILPVTSLVLSSR